MNKTAIITAVAALLLAVGVAQADVVADDFEGGVNMGYWSFSGGDVIETTGGNPGAWLHSPTLDTFAPILDTAYGVEFFTGDYVAGHVTRISGDFQTLHADFGTAGYPLALLLRDAAGTYDNIEDDVYVYWVDENLWIPQAGDGWTHYDFDIPSDFEGAPGELPAGWFGGSYMTGSDVFPSDRTWQSVLANVEKVEFWWIHPAWFGIFQQWEAGADNIELELMVTTAAEESSLSAIKALY